MTVLWFMLGVLLAGAVFVRGLPIDVQAHKSVRPGEGAFLATFSGFGGTRLKVGATNVLGFEGGISLQRVAWKGGQHGLEEVPHVIAYATLEHNRKSHHGCSLVTLHAGRTSYWWLCGLQLE
ncbi:MAG: hypothetical protein JSV36_10320, partial [Anaerolineae bacterium]